MTEDDLDKLRRKLRHGDKNKAVFLEAPRVKVVGAETDEAKKLLGRRSAALVGFYRRDADPLVVHEDIEATRVELVNGPFTVEAGQA